MSERFLVSDPYPWPYDGRLHPANTALIIIDMQTDFCGEGGYVDTMGYDLAAVRAPIDGTLDNVQGLLTAWPASTMIALIGLLT